MARFPFLNADGTFQSAQVKTQLDARTDARMRDQLPALAEELGIGGSGSGVEEVSGTVTLDGTGPAVREFFTTGATVFKANGVDTLASAYTAVVWRRIGGGTWSFIVVDGWQPTAAPDPNATIPVTPLAPTWTNNAEVGGGSWTTLLITGVGYYPTSGLAAPGEQVTVVATAKPGYSFPPNTTASWSHTFPTKPAKTVGTLAQEIAKLSPVGYWKMDETSGTVASDSSGFGRHGTYSGAVTLAGRSGAPVFAGGHVEIADAADFTMKGSANGYSVFALTNMDAVSASRQFIVAKGSANAYEWNFEAKPSGTTWETSLMAPGGSPATYTVASGNTAATWHALCATIAQPVSGAKFDSYIDSNTPAATTTGGTASSWEGLADTSNPLRIGNRGDGAGAFRGAIRHVALFRTKLTADQVGTLMLAAKGEGLIA